MQMNQSRDINKLGVMNAPSDNSQVQAPSKYRKDLMIILCYCRSYSEFFTYSGLGIFGKTVAKG